jgi:hypothetical protein
MLEGKKDFLLCCLLFGGVCESVEEVEDAEEDDE